MALNRSLIGKVYDTTDPWTVEAAAALKYAQATRATHPRYKQSGPEGMVPPMYAVVFQFLPTGAPLFDQELGVNMMRLVHGDHDLRFHAPVQAGDVITTTTTVANITDKTSGELLELALKSTNQRGEVVVETTTGLFIRGRTRRGAAAAADAKDPRTKDADSPRGAVVLEKELAVPADQSAQYADASGDHNPIHTDPEVAKAAGLPDIIVHGLCTMAMVHNVLVETFCGPDPLKLQRLRVTFAKPVLNGDTLALKAFEGQGPGAMAVEVCNAAGQLVITGGLAQLR